jgi:hypothetical protein
MCRCLALINDVTRGSSGPTVQSSHNDSLNSAGIAKIWRLGREFRGLDRDRTCNIAVANDTPSQLRYRTRW